MNNEVRIDYEYDSELEWENEPSDAESCCSLSDSGGDEDLGDDKFEENDEFCVPHGYLSDDEEGHDQMKADKNLNYKKKKLRILVPRVMVYKNCGENNEMDTDTNISQRESVTSQTLVKNLHKIGIEISSEKTTVLKPTVRSKICGGLRNLANFEKSICWPITPKTSNKAKFRPRTKIVKRTV